MEKAELKKSISKIRKLITQRDYGLINSGIELARSLNNPTIYEELLKDCSIEGNGSLVGNKIFSGSDPALVYLYYALLNLIAYAPEGSNLDKSLKHSNITIIDLMLGAYMSYKSFNWTELPSGISCFKKLKRFHMYGCESLMNLDFLSENTNLESLSLHSCYALQNLDGLTKTTNLDYLVLNSCHSLNNLDGLINLTNLKTLKIRNSRNIQNTDCMRNLNSLTNLHLEGCENIQMFNKERKNVMKFNGLSNLSDITSLNIISCPIKNVDFLANLTNLRELDLNNCRTLMNVDGLANLTKITSLDLTYCQSLENVDGLANLTNLTKLYLGYCDALKNLDSLANLSNLTELRLTGCSSLESFDGITDLPNFNRIMIKLL